MLKKSYGQIHLGKGSATFNSQTASFSTKEKMPGAANPF